MTSEQKKISNMLIADGFPLIDGGVGAVLHRIEGEICAAIDDDGVIDLVRPTGRGMILIEDDEVPHRVMDDIITQQRRVIGSVVSFDSRSLCWTGHPPIWLRGLTKYDGVS